MTTYNTNNSLYPNMDNNQHSTFSMEQQQQYQQQNYHQEYHQQQFHNVTTNTPLTYSENITTYPVISKAVESKNVTVLKIISVLLLVIQIVSLSQFAAKII
jgi:hypothetical protein